jgi:hypothetical protein
MAVEDQEKGRKLFGKKESEQRNENSGRELRIEIKEHGQGMEKERCR